MPPVTKAQEDEMNAIRNLGEKIKTGPVGGRKVTSKKAAKKTCAPGYAVYNFRKTRKGVFYDCAPKRTTRRR